MKEVRTIAPNPGFPLTLGDHRFMASADGKRLLHFIDGELRADIPPEGFADYLEAWPQAKPVIEAIGASPSAAKGPGLEL